VFPWLRRFTYAFSQIDPYIVRRRRPRPALIRPYQSSDFAACRALYERNEPGRFPPGGLAAYEDSLQRRSSLYLVVEHEGRIVGCGGVGIQSHGQHRIAHLCYGLIDPTYHRQGFGSILLLSRLSILPEGDTGVYLTTVPSSERFYQK
jgi:ribosomal protein S18 acetylase RimI-like enzyme